MAKTTLGDLLSSSKKYRRMSLDEELAHPFAVMASEARQKDEYTSRILAYLDKISYSSIQKDLKKLESEWKKITKDARNADQSERIVLASASFSYLPNILALKSALDLKKKINRDSKNKGKIIGAFKRSKDYFDFKQGAHCLDKYLD